MSSNFHQYNNPTRRTRLLRNRNRAASKIQSAARRTRITESVYGQLNEFLTHLSQSPNVILLEVLSVSPPNPPNTLTLMVDTRTQGGATKRTLLCIDVDIDGKINDINADCIKDRMPREGLAFPYGYGSRYSEMGPSTYGGHSMLGDVSYEQLNDVQNQLSGNFEAKNRGYIQYNPAHYTRYPLVTQLGLSPQELLDIIEGGNYCSFPIFKKLCKKLRTKIKNRETYNLSPQELKAIKESFSSDNAINITDAKVASTPSKSISTRSYDSDDIRNLMNGELLNGTESDWLGMSPSMSPNILFPSSDDIPSPPSSPPPSPPRLGRTSRMRHSTPSGSPPARRARRS